MIGFLVRCHLPLPEFGRLDLPRARMRYRNGWVRWWQDRAKDRLTAVLEDRDGHAMGMQTQAEARAEAVLMGQVIVQRLQAHTKVELMELTGDRRQSRVVVG